MIEVFEVRFAKFSYFSLSECFAGLILSVHDNNNLLPRYKINHPKKSCLNKIILKKDGYEKKWLARAWKMLALAATELVNLGIDFIPVLIWSFRADFNTLASWLNDLSSSFSGAVNIKVVQWGRQYQSGSV